LLGADGTTVERGGGGTGGSGSWTIIVPAVWNHVDDRRRKHMNVAVHNTFTARNIASTKRNLAIANRSRVSCANKVTTVNFQQDPYFPPHINHVAALPCEILNIKKNKTLK